MLPRSHRMVSADEFRRTTRHGRRSGSRTLLVYADLVSAADSSPARIGFVVSRAVGNAVTRNRVKRRLRHLMRERLAGLPGGGHAGGLLVVRALPPSASATSARLAADLDRGLARVLTSAAPPVGVSS